MELTGKKSGAHRLVELFAGDIFSGEELLHERVIAFRSRLDELALVQVLPSGWEIENIRLLEEAVPSWMKKWNLNREEYLDIRAIRKNNELEYKKQQEAKAQRMKDYGF